MEKIKVVSTKHSFYYAKDPKTSELFKDGRAFLCLDDWGNLFTAYYHAAQDALVFRSENDEGYFALVYLFDEETGYYTVPNDCDYIASGPDKKPPVKNIFGNKIMKLMPENNAILRDGGRL